MPGAEYHPSTPAGARLTAPRVLPDGVPDAAGAPGPLPAGYQPHTLALGQQTIHYGVQRAQRRTIGMTVRELQVLVRAPRWVSQGQIDGFVRAKAAWIAEKLALNQAYVQQRARQLAQWAHQGRIAYRGTWITVHLGAPDGPRFDGDPLAPGADDSLHLPLPLAADAASVRQHAVAWLRGQAKTVFAARLAHYLALADERLLGWNLSSARSRWGSCSGQRRIRLHWQLVQLAPALCDYVIAHEVAHLKQMNHSPAFWQEVRRLYPDYAQARARLRQLHPDTLIDPEG